MNATVQQLWLIVVLLVTNPAMAEVATFRSNSAQVTLLELFTSEGCSSCPPADRWMSGLVNDQRLWRELIPIVYHVDYWDGLGWRDPFAQPAHAARQRRYASAGGHTQVYTPGFFVQGREWRGWFRGTSLVPAQGNHVDELELLVDDAAKVQLRFTPRGTPAGTLHYTLAVLGVGLQTAVLRGENAGRNLTHDFVVLGLHEGELATAGQVFSAALAVPVVSQTASRYALVAWVTEGNTHTSLQATGGWLPVSFAVASRAPTATR